VIIPVLMMFPSTVAVNYYICDCDLSGRHTPPSLLKVIALHAPVKIDCVVYILEALMLSERLGSDSDIQVVRRKETKGSESQLADLLKLVQVVLL